METIDREKERYLEAVKEVRKVVDEALVAAENAVELIEQLKFKLSEDRLNLLTKFDKAHDAIVEGLKK